LRYYLGLARDLGDGEASENARSAFKEVGAMLNSLVSKTLKMDPGRFA
jgi:hypothetical protein